MYEQRLQLRTPNGGFTIVELMVSLAVAAILLGLAVPAFNDFVRQRTMSARVNDFVLAVTYARSEAIRRGGLVSVRAAAPAAGNEWGGGYCVAVGAPANCEGAVLRRFDAMTDATLGGNGGLDGAAILSFNARGLLTLGAAGSVRLCSVTTDPGRIVNISFIGSPDANNLVCN
jgi:type IV fimbrial biogenesis protein FimT